MDRTAESSRVVEALVAVEAGPIVLEGNLSVPDKVQGLVLFAHGSGSSRHSPRNRFVASELQAAGLGTLLMDLLTAEESIVDQRTGHLRFDIGFLAERLVHAIDWLAMQPRTAGLSLGCFGASTGGGAALVAATERSGRVRAVVSRGGRPDLASDALPKVTVPTLLIVGGDDDQVIRLNEQALGRLGTPTKDLIIVPGASHLFEEPGKLQEVGRLAANWFMRHLCAPSAGRES